MRVTIRRGSLAYFLTIGLLCPILPAQIRRASLKADSPTMNSDFRAAATPLAGPSDSELLKIVDLAIQRTVFESLQEVSLSTYVEYWPGSGFPSELRQDLQEDITARLQRMGLKVSDTDISSKPVLSINLQLVRLAGVAQYFAYYLELAVCERVTLKRDSAGEPPAKTYRFREAGQFTNERLVEDLKAAYGRLLDSLQRALEVARQAP